MKKKLFLWAVAVVCLTACSGSDDLLTDTGTGDTLADADENVTREQLMGDVPIEFADFVIGASATVDEEPTRGSISNSAFNSGTLGVFCLGATVISDEFGNISWSRSTQLPDTRRLLGNWLDNAEAHIVSTSGTEGKLRWNNPNDPHYYPSKDWYTYNFMAYHPRTDAIRRSIDYIAAYIPVDGNDDVFYAVAEKPRVSVDTETDALAYSSKYFDAVGAANITDAHKPYFKFRHLMSRLRFTVRLKENPVRPLHVDSIAFDDFPCIMVLTTMGSSTGLVDKISSRPFVLNNDDLHKLPDSIQAKLPASAFGKFWLREQNDESISGQMSGGTYKYNLTTVKSDYIGDAILIPPVYAGHSRSNLKLKVFLRDDNGEVFTTLLPIEVASPASGWEQGKEYTINVALTPPKYFMDDTRGEIDSWEVESNQIDVED